MTADFKAKSAKACFAPMPRPREIGHEIGHLDVGSRRVVLVDAETWPFEATGI